MKLFLTVSLLAVVQCAQIINLPGQPKANFNQYAGYYTVGKTQNHRLHYWFQESQGNPSTDPLLLWLTGGPGCSGLSAILTEWGPFLVNDDGATLRRNPFAWNQNASILTLESPAGVGYSYATDGNIDANDDRTASENWEALRAFLTEFPQYKKNDFYVTGESYGGVYVPTLVQYILDNQATFNINIKGFAIGNGMVSSPLGDNALLQFEHKHGIIDELQWNKAKTQCCQNSDTDDCDFSTFENDGGFCGQFVYNSEMNAWAGGLNPYNLYADCTNQESTRFKIDFKRKFGQAPPRSQADGGVPCMNETAVTVYLNRRDVRSALQVPGMLPAWSICNDQINENYKNQYDDLSPQVKNAISKGLKVMLYYGDVDMACNFLMGQKFASKLGLTQTQAKKAYHLNGQIGGFVTKYGALNYVTVRGAGHMVPTDKPPVAIHILNSFLRNQNF